MERTHGVTDSVEITNQTVPDPIGESAQAESSHATPQSPAPGWLGEPSHGTNVPPQDSYGLVTSGIYNMSLERFYCDDFNCGRGFSSKAQLESHTRFFHPNNVSGAFTPRGANADIPSSPHKPWKGRGRSPTHRTVTLKQRDN